MKKNFFITIIIIIAIILKIFAVQIVPLNDSTQIDAQMGTPETIEDYEMLYDINSLPSICGHFYYIMYIYQNSKLCDTATGQCYHPPIHYIISATWLHILDLFPLNSMQKIEGLQYVGIIYFVISLIIINKILKMLNLSDNAKNLIIILYSFFPKFTELTTLITNDFSVFVFELLILLYLIRWFQNPTLKNVIILSVCTGLGFLTKYNAAVMLAPLAICYLLKIIKRIKNKEDFSLIILQGCIFWSIFLFLACSYIFRCLIVLGDYYVPIPLEKLYIGNYNFSTIWGFYLKNLIFIEPPQIPNVWLWFLYSTLAFGNNFLYIIGTLNFILIILSIACIIVCFKHNDFNFKILAITFISQLIAYIFYNIRNPYLCTANSRYISIAIFLGIIFAGKFYDFSSSKILKILETIIIYTFCIFSTLSFLIFL